MDEIRLPQNTVDSHFHAGHIKAKGLPVIDILNSCFEKGLKYCIDIGTDLETFEERKAIANNFPNMLLSIGLYPSIATREGYERLLGPLRKIISNPKVIAVGECGLDYYRNYGKHENQKELFHMQLEIANEHGVPIIAHNRNADADVLELIRSVKPAKGGIMHCFSSDYDYAKKMHDMGFYISFAGNVTYKKAEGLRAAAKSLPLNALLIETDAPYLPPQPVRGRINHPGYIGHTYEFIASMRNMSIQDLADNILYNFKRLFELK